MEDAHRFQELHQTLFSDRAEDCRFVDSGSQIEVSEMDVLRSPPLLSQKRKVRDALLLTSNLLDTSSEDDLLQAIWLFVLHSIDLDVSPFYSQRHQASSCSFRRSQLTALLFHSNSLNNDIPNNSNLPK